MSMREKLGKFTPLLILLFLFAATVSYSFTASWDEDDPAGTDNPRSGDDEIRETRVGVRERIAIDHFMTATDDSDATGYHKTVTLLNEDLKGATTPTAKANAFILYGADCTANGGTAACELWGFTEASTAIRLTTLGVPTRNIGQIVQIVNTQTGAVNTGTTILPVDDTIPQKTEGDEYMTLAITPTSAINKLYIEIVFYGAPATADYLSIALFQDDTANALAAAFVYAAEAHVLTLRYTMVAGTAVETTFKVRAGLNGAGTTTFNGRSSARKFGGVLASSITITEIQI